ESGKSIEDAARAGRYQLLSAIANEVGATSIVTGHHMGDQAETILLHLLRGTGSRGLQGMHPVSNVPGDANGRLNLIRPMLSCTRDDIEAYAQHYQLRPAEDPSNRDVSFVRNRIRHELLPLLCEYNPQIVKTLSQLADHMQHERQLLDTLFKEAWQAICLTSSSRLIKLDLDRFTAAPVGIQRRVLREVVQQLTGSLENVSFDVIEQARKIVMRRETGLSADLGRQVQVRLTYGIIEGRSRLAPWQVEWEEEWPQLPLDIDTIPIALNRPSRHQLGHGFEIDVTLLDREQLDIRQTSENLWLAFIAVDDSSEIIIRRRMSGERFIPHGFDGHVKLKKLMIDRKIPAYVRENWPVVADQVGLLWIPGLRLAKRAAVQPDRPNHIIIKVEITRGN
ncbi:MAG: tRNA lysidine(34) synthetase TilS, partial [Chloroflexota bacterium]